MPRFSLCRRTFCRRGGILLALSLLGATLWLLTASHIDRMDLALPDDAVFHDRDGRLLRHLPDAAGERHLAVPLAAVPPAVRQAFLAAEDERFYDHAGFDLAAIVRALKDNLHHGRIVSGASTITQQLIRQIHPRQRTYRDKLIEIVRAARLERLLDKDEIFAAYLNRVPMGNNLRGVEIAARVYFGKEVAELSVAEGAVLAALPKAPGELNPYGPGRRRLLQRQQWVLSRLAQTGALSGDQLAAARDEAIVFAEAGFPFAAPHLVDLLIARTPAGRAGPQPTTIDLGLQQEAERILAAHAARLAYKGASQAAALVVHNRTMEVLAAVGSIAYRAENQGFNNGAAALRSPGSTLKPLVYGLALEDGLPATTLLEDLLRRYRTPEGDYTPANYDRHEYGPVTMRVALANSLNISAIRMLEAVGQERFHELLRRVGLINDPAKGADHYGLGLVLGNPEVTLEQLAAAYAMLANEGVFRPLRYERPGTAPPAGERIFSAATAYIVTDILSDPSARLIAFGAGEAFDFPFRVAFKTGTSTRYRDAWIVGYSADYTVAVWAGNFAGNPTFALSGAAGAGPIFRDLINTLYRGKAPAAKPLPAQLTRTEVCGISGMRPGQFCRYVSSELFLRDSAPAATCTFHRRPEPVHELPAAYAGWVGERQGLGHRGSYRLRDLTLDPLDAWGSGELAGGGAIRTKNAAAPPAAARVTAAPPPPGRGPVTIGAPPQPAAEGGSLRILYPLAADRFILDNSGIGQQAIRLEAEVDAPLPYIDWFIDGQPYRRAPPPYATLWQPTRGRHRISAATPQEMGDAVEIFVE